MTVNPVIEVSAGLVFSGGKLLITQRRQGDHLEHLWEFPGGKREGSETFEQCLVRELREELGIEVKVGVLVEEITHAYPEKTVLLKFFRCTLESGHPRPIHCQDLAWVSPSQLAAFSFPPADEQLLRTLQTHSGLWSR